MAYKYKLTRNWPRGYTSVKMVSSRAEAERIITEYRKNKVKALLAVEHYAQGDQFRVLVPDFNRTPNPAPQVAFKLIPGRKFQFEDGTRGQEFKWTDLRDGSHGSFDLTVDKKAYNVKGDRPPQVLLKGAMESMVQRSGNPKGKGKRR